jgi:mannose-1-phosphate guanylyltransferase/phosphomannomutase
VKTIVLCAGEGRRLGALTRDRPKPLLPLCGEPLLGHTLRHLAGCGQREIGINLHHRGEQIRAFAGDGARFGVRIHYAEEHELQGTAGALLGFADWLRGEDALVLYGDLLLDQDLGALVEQHRKRRADATLLLHRRSGSNSHVELDAAGRIRAFVERPDAEQRRALGEAWVNSGVQVLSAGLLAELPAGPSDLPRDVYAPRCAELRMFGMPLEGYRCAIDSPERYAEAERALATGRCSPRGGTRG